MLTRDVDVRPAPPSYWDVVTVPVPEPAPPSWAIPEATFYWSAPNGDEMAGLGIAAEVRAHGPDRFALLRRRAEHVFAGLHSAGPSEHLPRLFGGLAFAPGESDPRWAEFGDAWFVLPRALYRRIDGQGWLTLVSDGGRGSAREKAAAMLSRLVGAARRHRGPVPTAIDVRELDPARWRSAVGSIHDLIATRGSEKIVLARRTDVELDRSVDPSAVLARLEARHPNCYRFGLRAGSSLFMGASPERLVSLRGRTAQTESLAGSIAGSGGPAARALMGSRKERGEQAVVTRAVARALAPLCDRIEIAREPVVHELRDVVHLRTPVIGHLRARRHLLEVAEALHPTPAVAGEPRQPALDWIAQREGASRGWYAGPIGWFDSAGDGELAVAIRSGLTSGTHLDLWAGAGIVALSDADSEYAETGVKQRALLDLFASESEP